MTTYRQRVQEIERRLGARRLVFFGTRGTDARPLLALDCFAEVFSQIAPLGAISVRETCLETIKRERVDLDSYSIDTDLSPAVDEIRRGLLRAFSRPAAVIPYRPSAVLAAACFTRRNLVDYLGVFHEKQACFEHKPWVESQLAAAGVKCLPWTYYADEDLVLLREVAEAGPLVLRANRSDGGAGLSLIHDPTELQGNWPAHRDGFLAAAPFLSPNLPLNVNACVFPGGEVSMHAASVQLIGIEGCTRRRFGYCGNDFAAVAALPDETLDELEDVTRQVGRWLAGEGYFGVFGIDAMVYGDEVLFIELNPRFQGSSAMAATLARELDRPDLFLDHLASYLGLSAPASIRLRELARLQSAAAHVVCHNLSRSVEYSRVMDPDHLFIQSALVAAPQVLIAPDAIRADLHFACAVTRNGFQLLSEPTLAVGAALSRIISSS